jgi:3-deoxy-D-manno-octulosonate 8-phosphate phosphatase (KDO 8-P phosphatase)
VGSRAEKIVLLGMDVDGVLTDGSIYLDDLGHETKRFCVRDGFAIGLWQRLGFHAAIVTGRSGEAVKHRAAELGLRHVMQGVQDKAAAMGELLARLGLAWEQAAYMGDDWPDLRVMRRAGLAIAPADADSRVLDMAGLVTRRGGGRGAVREAIEHLIRAKGLMDRAVSMYDGPQA